jgi:hypothetical protein
MSPSHEPSPSHRRAILMAWPNLNFSRAISYLLYNNIFFLYVYSIQVKNSKNETKRVFLAVSVFHDQHCGLSKISTGANRILNPFLKFNHKFRQPRDGSAMAWDGLAKTIISTGVCKNGM